MKTYQEIMFSNLPKTLDEYLDKFGSESLRTNSSLVGELAENELITKKVLKKIVQDIQNYERLKELDNNNELLKCYVDFDCFDLLIEAYRNVQEYVPGEWNYSNEHLEYYYDMLLKNTQLFEYIKENNKLTTKLAKKLLDEIDSTTDLEALCECSPVIECLLKNFLIDLDEERNLETEEYSIDNGEYATADNAFERKNINIFEYIKEYFNNSVSANDEIKILIELNEKHQHEQIKLRNFISNSSFSKKQKSALINQIQVNELARAKLSEIINNNLENEFDFDELMIYLKKNEKKSLINV